MRAGSRTAALLGTAVLAGVNPSGRPALAADIPGVLFAALDQPRMNFYVAPGADAPPLAFDLDGELFFSFQAFLDTGASGLLLSGQTADFLGVQTLQHNGVEVVFTDHGVGESTSNFLVSQSLWVGARKNLSIYDEFVPTYENYLTDFPTRGGPFNVQVGPTPEPDNPILQGLDVFGMPIIRGRVLVADVRPTGNFESDDFSTLDVGKTYLYEPGTPFNFAGQETDDPGIPPPAFQVKLSKVAFGRFTSVSPSDAPAVPDVLANPFIGPRPRGATNPPDLTPDDTPAVRISLGTRHALGSFLLDTGASVSMISSSLAAQLGVRYVEGTESAETPLLERFDPAHPELPGTVIDDTFVLDIGGIGGTVRRAGLYFDALLLSTIGARAYDETDPRNLNFVGAPLLIHDITLADPTLPETDPNATYTLDGIFGMNFMYGSLSFTGTGLADFAIDGVAEPYFDFFSYDDVAQTLSFSFAGPPLVPEPQGLALLALPAAALSRRRR